MSNTPARQAALDALTTKPRGGLYWASTNRSCTACDRYQRTHNTLGRKGRPRRIAIVYEAVGMSVPERPVRLCRRCYRRVMGHAAR